MIVDRVGKYRLLKDFWTRNKIGCGTIPAGTVITITQIDKDHRRVIGPSLMDWTSWDLPVESMEEA